MRDNEEKCVQRVWSKGDGRVFKEKYFEMHTERL